LETPTGGSRSRQWSLKSAAYRSVSMVEAVSSPNRGMRSLMEDFVRDLRYALRGLVRDRILSLAILLSLALGIGANTAIFSIVHSLFLDPLPVERSEELTAVFTRDERIPGLLTVSRPNFEDLRKLNSSFEAMAAWSWAGVNLEEGERPERIVGQLVTGNYFEVLGVKAAHGRTFQPEEDATPGSHPVVVLGHRLWRERFAGDPTIVDRTIRLNGRAFTVVGIAPAGFHGTFLPIRSELWVPMMMHRELLPSAFAGWLDSRRALLLSVFGRRLPGVSTERAAEDLTVLAQNLEEQYPAVNRGRSVDLVPLAQATMTMDRRDGSLRMALLLMAAVGIVLLVATVNVANLLLARSIARRREVAVRIALGAGGRRLARQMLTESLLLSVGGGLLGLLLAVGLGRLLWSMRPPFLEKSGVELALDPVVLLFTLGLALATGLAFGLVPALRASRTDVVSALRSKEGGGDGGLRVGRVLVVGQVALTLVAIILAGLFVESLRRTQSIQPGFEAEKLLMVTVDLDSHGFNPAQGKNYHRRLLEEVRALPGVAMAGLARSIPFGPPGLRRTIETFDGPSALAGESGETGTLIETNTVDAGFLRTLGISPEAGRDLGLQDRDGAPMVALINQATAELLWPGMDPVGRRFKFRGEEVEREVVGVIPDVRYGSLVAPAQPYLLLPLAQNYVSRITLFVRTTGDPAALRGTVERRMRTVEPLLPLIDIRTIGERIASSLWAPRLGAALLGLFGLLALLLAAVGIYGMLSYSVHRRRRELGLRIALGARRGDVITLILRGSGALLAAGVGVGVIAAAGGTRLVRNLLVGVGTADPWTYAFAILLLLAVGLVASLLPARSASRTDPLLLLRDE